MMIEVFKTNVDNDAIASNIASELSILFPGTTANFDLEDCDKILRVMGGGIHVQSIIDILGKRGYFCELLK